jgi:hypothetical protein
MAHSILAVVFRRRAQVMEFHVDRIAFVRLLLVLLTIVAPFQSPVTAATDGATDVVLKRASTSTPVVEQDGKRKGLQLRARAGTIVNFRVEGVNPLLYQVEIKGERQFLNDLSEFLTLLTAAKPKPPTEAAIAPAERMDVDTQLQAYERALDAYRTNLEQFSSGQDILKDLTQVMLSAETAPPPNLDDIEQHVQAEATAKVQTGIGSTDILVTKKQQLSALEAAAKRVEEQYLVTWAAIRDSTLGEDVKKNLVAQITTRLDATRSSLGEARQLLDTVYKPAQRVYTELLKPWSRSYQALEIGESEKITYTVKVTPLKESFLEGLGEGAAVKKAGLQERTHTVVVNSVGGLGLSVSSGFLLTGLTERSFEVRDGKIRRKEEDDFNPELGVLLHAYKNEPASITWAGSFGFNLENGNFTFFGGPSLLFGREKRIALSAGVAAGKVTELDGVDEGDAFTGATIPTRSVYRPTWFVGITFNFRLQ